jgi:hypothetical protein
MHRASRSGSATARCPRRCLLVEIDVLDEHDLAVVVFDDVVAVETVAVLIKVVHTFRPWIVFHTQERFTDLLRLKTVSVVDRERQNMNSVVGPCPMEIGADL